MKFISIATITAAMFISSLSFAGDTVEFPGVKLNKEAQKACTLETPVHVLQTDSTLWQATCVDHSPGHDIFVHLYFNQSTKDDVLPLKYVKEVLRKKSDVDLDSFTNVMTGIVYYGTTPVSMRAYDRTRYINAHNAEQGNPIRYHRSRLIQADYIKGDSEWNLVCFAETDVHDYKTEDAVLMERGQLAREAFCKRVMSSMTLN
jgi:ATP-dependent Clp protease adapter protein ClpS